MVSLAPEVARSALATGISYGNLAVALPLVVLASDGSPSVAALLLAAHTIAFSVGALCARGLRRAEAGVVLGLLAMAVGDIVLALAPASSVLAAGAVLNGIGMGLFWVGVQAWLGRRSGIAGSQRAFVRQYALYVLGTASGAALTGLAIAATRRLGAPEATSVSLTFLVGAAATVLVLPQTLGWLSRITAASPDRPRLHPFLGLSLQAPDLLLVAAMGMLLSLVPIVLSDTFAFSPLAIGVASACIAAAKIAGSLIAGGCAVALGSRATVGGMLGGSAVAAAALAATEHALVFVAFTVAATFFAIGVWPIVVDGALARVSPSERPELTVVWNVREYAMIAAATAGGGLLLDATTSPAAMLGIVTMLLLAAAVAALAVLRRPVYAPVAA